MAAALERINARLDNDFGFERHYIRGRAAMTARAGLALAIMMALALGHALEGRPGQMRSQRLKLTLARFPMYILRTMSGAP